MTIKKIIGAIVTVLSFGLITSHGGQIEIVEVDDYYAYGDERDPNAVFIGVDSWEGVTGEAWVDSAGQIVGGDLWIQDGSAYDGYWWGTADDYYNEFLYDDCRSYLDC